MDRLLLLMTTTTCRASAFLEAARRLAVPVVVGSDRDQVLAVANPGGHLTLDFLAPEEASLAIVEFFRRYTIGAVVQSAPPIRLSSWRAFTDWPPSCVGRRSWPRAAPSRGRSWSRPTSRVWRSASRDSSQRASSVDWPYSTSGI